MTEAETLSLLCSASPSVAILIVWFKMSARIDILNARIADLSVRISTLEKLLLTGGKND